MSLGIVSRSFKRGSPHAITKIDGRPYFREQGNVWFVDSNRSGSGDGKSLESPMSTMAEAFAKLSSGDTIYFRGTIREQLVTPVQVFDVSVIGLGNRPRHADSTPAGGQLAANSWRAPASGAVVGKATVRVLQQGWSFENILFTAEGATAGMIELVRNADAGNAERDASHAIIRGCRFAGAGIGIAVGAAGFTELVFNVLVENNRFNSCTTAIGGTGQLNQPVIRDNHFSMNTNSIKVAVEGGTIYDNIMGKFTTKSIDISGGVGTDPNVITKNYLFGTYSNVGGYTGHHADDEWAGNWNTLAGGITIVDPA